ncbi:unnamed protein product [Strongylus vulgaris]|uniref:C-type lectin domain-containing protein n=1 Tax=Strongylus vulgaris TaxID=40348 RepID=A0A3P7ICY9_STRVU|nr:unnamed protein product [Strongylus vulgaris]
MLLPQYSDGEDPIDGFLLLGLLPLTGAFTCPANTIYHEEFSRCYKFSTDPLPFYMAEEACIDLGGHLISLGGGLENAMVAGRDSTAAEDRLFLLHRRQ